MTDRIRVANGRFARGFNCSQAVFSAFAEEFGIESALALRMASPFGAGMAREGEVCGALTGALMVLGIRYGADRPEAKDEIYTVARGFIDEFRQRHGSILCRALVGHDISTTEGLQAAKAQNVFAAVCPRVVDETAKALAQHLSDHPLF